MNAGKREMIFLGEIGRLFPDCPQPGVPCLECRFIPYLPAGIADIPEEEGIGGVKDQALSYCLSEEQT